MKNKFNNRYIKQSVYFNQDYQCFYCGLCFEYIEVPRLHVKEQKHIKNFRDFDDNLFIVKF